MKRQLPILQKLLANSLWGKLAQRVGSNEVHYTRTPAEFHSLLENTTMDIVDFEHVSPHMDRVVVRKKPEFAAAPPTNCLPVAIFVTSYARLHLYGYMEQVERLGHKILYCGKFCTINSSIKIDMAQTLTPFIMWPNQAGLLCRRVRHWDK